MFKINLVIDAIDINSEFARKNFKGCQINRWIFFGEVYRLLDNMSITKEKRISFRTLK